MTKTNLSLKKLRSERCIPLWITQEIGWLVNACAIAWKIIEMYITADILRSRLNSKAGQVLVLEELLSCPSLGWGMRMGLSQCKGFRWPSSITVWVTDTGPTALGISCFSLNNSTVTNSNQSYNYPCCFISTMSCIGTTADPVIL